MLLTECSIYLETSALLSWLFEEAECSIVIEAIDQSRDLVMSTFTLLEAKRNITKFEVISKKYLKKSWGLLEILEKKASQGSVMELTEAVKRRILAPFPIEPVRTLDAIHLASALEFQRIFPDLRVLSFDKRIQENLSPLGLPSALDEL